MHSHDYNMAGDIKLDVSEDTERTLVCMDGWIPMDSFFLGPGDGVDIV